MFNTRIPLAHLAALLVAALVLYAPTSRFDFAYDDILQIEHNPLVVGGEGNQADFLSVIASPTPPGNLYRPLTLLTYRANFLLSGLSPRAFHITNILLYLACCVLFYIFVLQVLEDRSIAFLSSLIFTTHPVHVEVVANIIGRAEMLAFIAGLGACICLRTGLHSEKKTTQNLNLVITIFLFLAASLSKESALTFLVLAPLYAIAPFESGKALLKQQRNYLIRALLFLAFAAVMVLTVRARVLGSSFRLISDGATVYPENPIFHLSFFERIIPALKILGDYILQLILPVHISADYSVMPEVFLAQVYSLTGVFSIAAFLVYVLLVFSRRRSAEAIFGLWFLLSLSLTSNILTPIGTLRGDRLIFLPGAGLIPFFLAVAYQKVCRKPEMRVIFYTAASTLLLFFIGRSLYRVPIWQSNAELFSQTVLDAPESPKARYNLAVLFYQQQKYVEASAELKQALQVHPRYLFALKLMADISFQQRNIPALKHWYKRILELDPENKEIRRYLAQLENGKQRE